MSHFSRTLKKWPSDGSASISRSEKNQKINIHPISYSYVEDKKKKENMVKISSPSKNRRKFFANTKIYTLLLAWFILILIYSLFGIQNEYLVSTATKFVHNSKMYTEISIEKELKISSIFDQISNNFNKLSSNTEKIYSDRSDVLKSKPSNIFLNARGWHINARNKDENKQEVNKINRLKARPILLPQFHDPGEAYLPFNKEYVKEYLMNGPDSSLLYYDINIIRLNDKYGLINDKLNLTEITETFQKVVDIFAQANIYIRINKKDLRYIHSLPKTKSLAYLRYVEGPDLAEQMDLQKPKSLRIIKNEKRIEYVEWFQKEMRKVFPVPSFELLLRGPKSTYTTIFNSESKSDALNILSDWAIGYPYKLTPWDLAHGTTIFPVFYTHLKTGSVSSGGHIVSRTGSCFTFVDNLDSNSPERKLNESDTSSKRYKNQFTPKSFGIEPKKRVTCKGFENNLQKRFQSKTIRPQQGGDHFELEPYVMGRNFAHDLAHTMLQTHPRPVCTWFDSWEKGLLMHPPEFIAVKGEGGCGTNLHRKKFKAIDLSLKHIQNLRAFVKNRDIRQTQTLPNAITIGESTEQIGNSNPKLYERILKNNKNIITGSGKSLTANAKVCDLPQGIIILNKIPAPFNGNVLRVRWLPTRFQIVNNFVHILVVRPVDNQLSKNESLLTTKKNTIQFNVIHQTNKPIKVPLSTQNAHHEIDISHSLPMQKGDLIAIASIKSKEVRIDTRLFNSDKVLYSDIVGNLITPASNLMNALFQFEETPSVYPKILAAPLERHAFFYSKEKFSSEIRILKAHLPKDNEPDKWCSQPIVNYDLEV